MEKGLTNPQRILIAAAALPGDHFAAADLIARVYEDNRGTFGLPGYEDRYPDSNKVLSYVMGTRRLVAIGYLEKVGPKTYRLTRQGRALVTRALAGGGRNRALPVQPPADFDTRVEALVNAPAFRRWLSGLAHTVKLADARAFLRADPEGACRVIPDYLVAGVLRLRSGQVVEWFELSKLCTCAADLRGLFGDRVAGPGRRGK